MLTERFELLPASAQLVYLKIRQALADSADANHTDVALSYSTTDLQRLRVTSLEAVNVDALEQALIQGMIEPLDLTTPIEDKGFYLGVSVQPGHIASGYLAPRPVETAETISKFDSQKAVLIAGPSGTGKSALLWLAANQTAHEIAWFRTKRLTADAIEPIERLIRAFHAGSSESRIGIIVDDVGRTPGLWEDLVSVALTRPGIVLLGSIREEDLALVAHQQVGIVRPELDEPFAEAMYHQLKQRDETTWAGWREPFEISRGLLMEFVHVLTAGNRLEVTITDQINSRLTDVARHLELNILRIAAMADTYGCQIRIENIRTYLELTDDVLNLALMRLYDEHLVRRTGNGLIGGLHPLRSSAIVKATHAIGSPTQIVTALRLLHVLDGLELSTVIAALLEPVNETGEEKLRSIGLQGRPDESLTSIEQVHRELQERLEREPSIGLVISTLQGLRVAGFRHTAEQWNQIMETAHVALPIRSLLVNLAISKSDLEGDLFRPLAPLIEQLRATQIVDFRLGMENAIEVALAAVPTGCTVQQVEAMLLATAHWDASESVVRTAAANYAAEFGNVLLSEKVSLLEAASVHSPDTAACIADALGGEGELLAEYAVTQPWIFELSRSDSHGVESTVSAKWLFIDSPIAHGDSNTLQSRDAKDVHDAVVDCCRDLLALQPSAEIAEVVAVDAAGNMAGFGDHVIADKKIPRSNLPTIGTVVWNRIRLVLADMFDWRSSGSATDRVIAEAVCLSRLVSSLETYLDYWVLGTLTRSPVPNEVSVVRTELASN